MEIENLSGKIKIMNKVFKNIGLKEGFVIFLINTHFHHRIFIFSILNKFSKIYENLHYPIYP